MPYHTFAVSHIYFIIQPLHKKVNRHNLIVFCRINARLYAFYIKRPPERRSFRQSINLLIIKKWGVECCLLCWFCIVQNFWQATKASLLWGVAPVQVVSHLCHCICALTAICAVASCNGFVLLSLCVLA